MTRLQQDHSISLQIKKCGQVMKTCDKIRLYGSVKPLKSIKPSVKERKKNSQSEINMNSSMLSLTFPPTRPFMTGTTIHITPKGPTSKRKMIPTEQSGTHLSLQAAGGPVPLEGDHTASFNQALQGHCQGSSVVSVDQQDNFPFQRHIYARQWMDYNQV